MSSAVGRRSVDRSIRVQKGRGKRGVSIDGAKVVQHGVPGSCGADLEEHTQAIAAAGGSHSIQKLVAALHDPRIWSGTVDAARGEVHQHLINAASRYPE